ncbi:HopJ type III effector protein [Vibrio sonorensis]|uniref:HopJ type III effector protein n=1 Tax=Vibrio sonorensis TaxID=1004316 RepID=UPI0008D8EB66
MKSEFLAKLSASPETIDFNDTMAVIDANYDFTPSAFVNGDTTNEAGQNNGSCKLFAFAHLNKLNEEQTLACFGAFYREDVLKNPNGDDHQNIRNFIKSGWSGIKFENQPLTEK